MDGTTTDVASGAVAADSEHAMDDNSVRQDQIM
jgi:hypothetical protein